MPRRLSRRRLLLGAGGSLAGVAGGLALVNADVLPGHLLLRRALGACDVGGALPTVTPGRVEAGSFPSAARGRTVGYSIVYPPGATSSDPLPVCLYLHGRGGDHRDVAGHAVGLPWILAARTAAGVPPFVLVGADGGTGYWHGRANGDDAGRMLTDDLLPLLASRGLRTDRIGLLGASMGGYGALLLAETLGAERVAAAGALSPALWRQAGEAVAGAFDSPADFATHDVFAGRDRLAGIPVRVDCGRDDPFADGARAFLAGAPQTVTGAIHAGCHDSDFWRSVAPDHIDRIGRALGG